MMFLSRKRFCSLLLTFVGLYVLWTLGRDLEIAIFQKAIIRGKDAVSDSSVLNFSNMLKGQASDSDGNSDNINNDVDFGTNDINNIQGVEEIKVVSKEGEQSNHEDTESDINASVVKDTTKAVTKDSDNKEAKPEKKFDSIMPSMPDLKAKQELGRASWKYFHTLLARYPDEPTEEESTKLENFVQLYAELYPCGECSYHFVKMLEKHPVQTSSRTAAAMWGCHIHNIVNEYLKKDEYDCSTILEDYDCGCGKEPNEDVFD